jgi:hypothetical protein
MGMYTGFKGKIKIKEKYADEFYKIVQNNYNWEESNIDFFKEYSKVERANFIPRGYSCYFENWNEKQYNEEERIWTFSCSLKNYEYTIQKFINIVLSEITEKIFYLKKRYEEIQYSTCYELKNGKIIKKEKQPKRKIAEIDNHSYYGDHFDHSTVNKRKITNISDNLEGE